MKHVAVEHRLARFLGVGHGEEAHQDVRQTGGAEHQRHAQRDRLDRVGLGAGHHDCMIVLGMRGDRLENSFEVEALVRQHQIAIKVAPPSSSAGLDDLHPGRGLHAAEGDVDDDQHADDHDRHLVGDSGTNMQHELAGADHLRRSDRR
jgi:hypothetical protein